MGISELHVHLWLSIFAGVKVTPNQKSKAIQVVELAKVVHEPVVVTKHGRCDEFWRIQARLAHKLSDKMMHYSIGPKNRGESFSYRRFVREHCW